MLPRTRLRYYRNARKRVLLVSPPALGKSSLWDEVARETESDLVITAAGTKERVDFAGAIYPSESDGYARELLLETMYRLKHAEKPTIWFLDDLLNAPTDVQSAIKSQITMGGIIHKNPNVYVCGATNRPADKTGVSGLHESLRSEFHLGFAMPFPGATEKADGVTYLGTWEELFTSWCDWAFEYGAPPEIVAWHRSTAGTKLYAWKPHADPAMRMPDFRTWHAAIDLWNSNLRDLTSLGAAIGKPAAIEFLAFADLAMDIPTPEQIRVSPEDAPVPTSKPAALYLIASTLAAASEMSWLTQLLIYLNRMPRVFGALLGRDLYKKHESKLSGHKGWSKFFLANAQLFDIS